MTEIKERGILFSSEMVRAILDGRKTETRRVMRKQPYEGLDFDCLSEMTGTAYFFDAGRNIFRFKSPYGKPGGILYVRETFFAHIGFKLGDNKGVCYKADLEVLNYYQPDSKKRWYTWKPSIHMPKKFSRIKLLIKEIRVERVQEITEDAAIKEGLKQAPEWFQDEPMQFARQRFSALWDSLNKKRGFGWDTNCFVWVIKFERVIGGKNGNV